ncbi:predicted protein, partial [Nematostella vectensis]
VWASTRRLLLGAEKLKMRKKHKSGAMVDFCLNFSQEFDDFTGDGQGYLTTAECQRVVYSALNALKSYTDITVPGYSGIHIFKNRAIVPKLVSKGVVSSIYPLHEAQKLKLLEKKWFLNVSAKLPLDDIKEYFGETMAMYFAFLQFYSMTLIPPVLLIVVFALSNAHDQTKNTVFAVLNLLWATIFLEAWKRRCSEMSFKWGTLKGGIEVEEPRPNYWGPLRISPITGHQEQYYSPLKRKLKTYGISYPIVLLCMKVATVVMLLYFKLQFYMEEKYGKDDSIIATVLLMIPSVSYSVMIAVLNNIYHRIALWLTEWENHRLESSYNNHLIVKLVLFYFVNCFYSLFYIAFYLQDIALLRTHLAALMITSQVIGQITESLVPYLMFRSRVTTLSKEGKKIVVKSADLTDSIEKQGQQEHYTVGSLWTCSGDYCFFPSVLITVLFSSAYPMAAFWALLNNVIEIRTDAFKMCRIFQRPFSQPASSIGAWQAAFEAMSVIAVITNCALIGMAANSAHWLPDLSPANAVLMFVAIEHFLLGVKFLVAMVIPDVPQWVQDEMAKQDYQAKLAL